MSFSLAECVGQGLKSFSGLVRRGDFDRILLRPCSPILQVVGTRFEVGRLGPFVAAVITLVVGMEKSQISWGPRQGVVLVSMILGGIFLFVGLFMLEASFCIFSIQDGGMMNVLTYGAKEHGNAVSVGEK